MAPDKTNLQDTIAIVGGGIGGLTLAIGCLTQSVPIHVYEAAPSFGEIGAGVSFGPNALRAMQLISPSIWNAFQACLTNNASHESSKYWFRFRNGNDTSSKVGSSIIDLECATGQTSVHRARFLDELVKEVPEEAASFGKRLDNVDDRGEHVVLHFKDGTSARHAAVICCDGIKSRGRHILLGKDHPAASAVFSGKYAYRGLIPMDQAAELMGDDIARNSHMFLGKGGHVLTFPIEKGDTMNVVAFGSADRWDDPEWVKPMKKDDMRRDFAGFVEVVHEIVSLMQKPDLWALFEMPPAPTYFKNRICLLGDAAHASTPHQGAGAGMAIEDALVMSNLLAGLSTTEAPRAFKAFDTARRPRTQKLVTTSHDTGLLYEFQLPGAMDDTNLVADNLSKRLKWIWDFDLKSHVEEAKALLKQTDGTS
ncbi:FAD/NAD(P)-binding domain-containing protein [Myriangium duriaei CBS 260.36]|uniref:FAD/NAD(P)-binding domain-containing protein n=1 Tax=Myriangium duriaei CBS 260.36 TaxID=1168546 RepID=A0A9P4J4Y0_9PEZI|nr:FAD/NAD(P)-binding domain-containing protein [Myriangium duriaei CBS 260.36]